MIAAAEWWKAIDALTVYADAQERGAPPQRKLQHTTKSEKTHGPEFFDFIFIDECHRSIYNVWQQVLDYSTLC